MKDRIAALIKAVGTTPARLADDIGVQRSGISHILSGRNHPGYEFLQKVLLKYDKINAEWLLLGKGNMFKNSRNDAPDDRNKPLSLFTVDSNQSTVIQDVNSLKTPLLNSITDTSFIDRVTDVNNIEKIVVFYSNRTFREYSPESSV